MLGKKDGLATKGEIKVLWKIAQDELPIPGWLKPILSITLPGIIDGIDNKVGDRILEPWQSHCEELVTMVVEAAEDKVFTKEEIEAIMVKAGSIVDERIDIEFLADDMEAIMFLELFRMLGAGLYAALHRKKKELET